MSRYSPYEIFPFLVFGKRRGGMAILRGDWKTADDILDLIMISSLRPSA